MQYIKKSVDYRISQSKNEMFISTECKANVKAVMALQWLSW